MFPHTLPDIFPAAEIAPDAVTLPGVMFPGDATKALISAVLYVNESTYVATNASTVASSSASFACT